MLRFTRAQATGFNDVIFCPRTNSIVLDPPRSIQPLNGCELLAMNLWLWLQMLVCHGRFVGAMENSCSELGELYGASFSCHGQISGNCRANIVSPYLSIIAATDEETLTQ